MTDDNLVAIDPIDRLVKEFETYRNDIHIMIDQLESIRKNIDQLLPEQITNRTKFIFEERVKSITEVYKVLLDMKKEIGKSLKDEIEIRRKGKVADEFNLEDLLDIRNMSKKVEEFQKNVIKLTNKKEKINE